MVPLLLPLSLLPAGFPHRRQRGMRSVRAVRPVGPAASAACHQAYSLASPPPIRRGCVSDMARHQRSTPFLQAFASRKQRRFMKARSQS